MESFDYKNLGETIPPSPIISIRLTAPDWLERSSGKFVDCEALLDTGADFTLIPLEMVSVLQLEVIEFSVPIDGIGGGTAYGLVVMPILSWGNNPFGQSVFMVVNGV